jgi:23S rRNA pseudouridine2604 synthase
VYSWLDLTIHALRFLQLAFRKHFLFMNPHTSEGERLSKRVMQLRGCSRREAEQYIEGGFVSVDGVVVEEPQFRVSTQTVTLDSHASVMNLSAITIIVNKPVGWLDGLQEAPGGRKPSPRNVRSLLDPKHHSAHDASGVRQLKRHFHALEASVPLESGASGLVVFTQDFRTQRKLVEDMAFMEHELVVDVRGEVFPDDLRPIERALKDDRLRLPFAKVSVGSATPERSKLRMAIKGAHPGLAAYLCELAKFEILALRRIRLGRVSLSDLDEGTWRYLAPGEKF